MKDFLKENITKPVFQLAAILLVMVVLSGIIHLSMSVEMRELNPNSAWEIMASCVLFFSLVNCVFSLQTTGRTTYWRNSIFSFMGLLLIGGGLAWVFTGVPLMEAGSISWILFVFSFGYLIFLSIANIMRFVVELAQRQDSRLRGEE
jgi:hypothetical protein